MSAFHLPTSGVIGRLAPTPSGKLHLGNALSFAAAWLSVRQAEGTLLLRIEDIDPKRTFLGRAQEIREDLHWLGLTWDREVASQSTRSYQEALNSIRQQTYRCSCSRREIRARHDHYDGHCRELKLTHGSLRFRLPNKAMTVQDRRYGAQMVDLSELPDPKLTQRNDQPCYIAAVVIDDIRDGVNQVVRGMDLLDQIAPQEVLWGALGATPPTWLHTPIIMGPDNQKLCKSHNSLTVQSLREAGITAVEIWRALLPYLGIDKSVLHLTTSPLMEATGLFNPLAFETGEIQSPFQ